MVGGVKNDDGKVRWDLMPSDALEEIAKVMTHGATKYGDRNWEKGMDWHRPFAACMRHMWAWWRGEDVDPESGISHLAHAGCCVLFLLSYWMRKAGVDNRERLHLRDPRVIDIIKSEVAK